MDSGADNLKQTPEQVEKAEATLYARKTGSNQATVSARSKGMQPIYVSYPNEMHPLAYLKIQSSTDPFKASKDLSQIEILEHIDSNPSHICLWIQGPQEGAPAITHGLWKALNSNHLSHATLLTQGCAAYSAVACPGDRGLVNDTKAAIYYLHRKYPSTKIILAAYGLGTGLAFHAVSEWGKEHPNSELLAHIVAVAPYSSMDDILQEQRLNPAVRTMSIVSNLSPITATQTLPAGVSIDLVQPNHRHQKSQLGPLSETLRIQHHQRTQRYQDGSSPTPHVVSLLKSTKLENPTRLFLYPSQTKASIIKQYIASIISSIKDVSNAAHSPFDKIQKDLLIPDLEKYSLSPPTTAKEKRIYNLCEELLENIKHMLEEDSDIFPENPEAEKRQYQHNMITIFGDGRSCEYSSMHVTGIAETFEEGKKIELGSTGVSVERNGAILHITTDPRCQAHIYFTDINKQILQEVNIRSPFIRVIPRHHRELAEFSINNIRYNVRPNLSLVADNG